MAFTHVLVPIEFSDPSSDAPRHASAEPTVHHAGVTLLHVLPPLAGSDSYYVTGAPDAGPHGGLDLITGGSPGEHFQPISTIIPRDLDEDARARLRDLVSDPFYDTDVKSPVDGTSVLNAAYALNPRERYWMRSVRIEERPFATSKWTALRPPARARLQGEGGLHTRREAPECSER